MILPNETGTVRALNSALRHLREVPPRSQPPTGNNPVADYALIPLSRNSQFYKAHHPLGIKL